MQRLLINSLAKEFYQQHAGFFLFGLYVLFGIGQPSDIIGFNIALLISGISSVAGMSVVFTLWLLYSLKSWFFVNRKLSLPQYTFVNEAGALNEAAQMKLWISLYSVILLPVLIYVVLLAGLSIRHQLYLSLLSIIIVFAVLIFGLARMHFLSITFGFLKKEKKPLFFSNGSDRPFFSWPLFYLYNEQLLLLLICKVFSFFMFKGILWMFADVASDIRTQLIALLASLLCHSVMLFNLLKFETEYLSFTRSMPVKTGARIVNWLLVLAIVLIPEWFFFAMAADYNLYPVIIGMLFGISGLFFLLSILYLVKLDMGAYLKGLLIFFFISMWIITGHYYVLLSIILLTYSTLSYFFRFDKFDLRGIE